MGPARGAMRHGGRLLEAAAAFPHAPTPWLDLSTGISPYPWKGARASGEMLRRLPDPADLALLEATAARAFGVEDPARVVAVPGAEAGLRLLPDLIGAWTVEIARRTYGGHAEAWTGAGVAIAEAGEAVVVVNPNNPDGRATSRGALLRALAEDRWLVVDESFVETAPELSVADVEHERLVVLRSFGKFYGLPGVRLGFVVAPPRLAARLRTRLGDWPISADAIALGQGAYADIAWREAMRRRLQRDAAALDRLLTDRGFGIVGGTSLFRLVAAPDASERFARLCEAGILTRPFHYEPTWLRFGVPAARDLGRLEAAL